MVITYCTVSNFPARKGRKIRLARYIAIRRLERECLMKRALIIEDNLIVGKILENNLSYLGFTSFDHVWTEAGAIAAAGRNLPDLILIGETEARGDGMRAARSICSQHDIPAILVTAGSFATKGQPLPGCVLEGPYRLSEIEVAVEKADGRALSSAGARKQATLGRCAACPPDLIG